MPTKTISAVLTSEEWAFGPLQVKMSKLMAGLEDFSLLIIPLFEYLNRVHFRNNRNQFHQRVLICHDLSEARDVLPELSVRTVSKQLRSAWGIAYGSFTEIPLDLSTLKGQHKVKFEGIDD